jgi:insertion element IS1 protein InsB
LPKVADSLAKARPDDVLELDEVCGYVQRRGNKVWTWTALCRRTRQVVAYVNGDRSEATCKTLWDRIPDAYRGCRTFSDFWKAYASIFTPGLHQSVGKETGEAVHMERWNNTLRQRVGRMVRKTLSSSKDANWHDGVIHWFVVSYNSSLSVNV